MKKLFIVASLPIIIVVLLGMYKFNYLAGLPGYDVDGNKIDNNMQSKDTSKMTLVLSAPSIHDEYYKSAFQEIINFQIDYANKILNSDDVKIIVDVDTKKYFTDKVPEEILVTDNVYDIWMRDFTTVNPNDPVQFVYTHSSMSESESKEVQKSFNTFANNIDLKRTKSNLLLDGGNIVDNHKGRVITTTRFLTDNSLAKEEGKGKLKEVLGATEVAIIEPDEEVLAHADGMVAFIDDDVLLVNQYKEEKFRDTVINELKNSFPNVKIIEIPVNFEENKKEWTGFNSACGVNLNLVLTNNSIYVPTFNSPNDESVLEIIRNSTTKKIIPVDASGVCAMGGSVRCLTWQIKDI